MASECNFFISLFFFCSIEESMRIIQTEIESFGGKFAVKYKPQVIGEDDSLVPEKTDSEASVSSSENDHDESENGF